MSHRFEIFEISLDSLLVISGLGFLAVAFAGGIVGKIQPTVRARTFAAIVGICLMAGAVWIHHSRSSVADSKAQSGRASLAIKVQAHEMPKERPAPADHLVANHADTGLAYFGGKWKNRDTKTRGLTTLNVRTSGESVWVHAWGACHPSDCDWGEVAGTPLTPTISTNPTNDANKVTAVFETSFSSTILTLSPSDDDELQADTQTRFTDNSGRSGYSATYTFRH